MSRKAVLAKTDVSEFEKPRNDALSFSQSLTITCSQEYQRAVDGHICGNLYGIG